MYNSFASNRYKFREVSPSHTYESNIFLSMNSQLKESLQLIYENILSEFRGQGVDMDTHALDEVHRLHN